MDVWVQVPEQPSEQTLEGFDLRDLREGIIYRGWESSRYLQEMVEHQSTSSSGMLSAPVTGRIVSLQRRYTEALTPVPHPLAWDFHWLLTALKVKHKFKTGL